MSRRKDKLVVWQDVREFSTKPCGEDSPFWNWMEMHGVTKEMDEVMEPIAPAYDPQLSSAIEALSNGAEDLMSEKEQKAFHYVVRLGYTYPRTAKKMKVKTSTIHKLVERAAQKLRILSSIH